MYKKFGSISRRFRHGLVAAFLLCLLPALAGSQGIPSTLGWYQIPNTTLRSVCAADHGFPQVSGNTGCAAITLAWSGGTFDTTRNRLIIWGGGHTDYYGNEIYALDLNNLTINRLTDPGLPTASSCTNSIAGGTQPNSRHSYGSVGYIGDADRLWISSGSLACASGVSPTNSGDIWTYNFSGTNPGTQWQSMNPAILGGAPGSLCGSSCFGWTAQYHSNKQLLFFKDIYYLYTYDFASNAVTQVSSRLDANLYTSAVIDTDRNLYIEIGGGVVNSFDISGTAPYNGVRRSATGATAVVNASSPGLAYDPIQKRVVAWDGGNTIYLLDTGTWTWSTVTYSGGPAKVGSQGTFGRFAYSPTSNVFVSCNSVDSNCYTLRLTPGGTIAPPGAPTVSIVANPTSVSSGSAATLTWNSTNASSCSASGGWSGAKATSGSQNTGNLTATTTFALTCTGSGGSANQSATVTVTSSTTPPPTSSGTPTLLVKFGKSSGLNTFGLSGWSTVIKDVYTDYQDIGPGGTTIVVGNNYSYNYQGVAGSQRSFLSGEKIRVTWYNNSTTSVTFTPNISFTSADRIGAGTGTWYPMSQVTVPAFGSATSESSFTSASAGSYSLVNVNVNYANTQVVIADKIELVPVGSSSSSFDFSLSNGGDKSVAQGQSVSNSISAALVSGTAQSITLSTAGFPSGAVPSLSVSSCTPTCATNLTISTASSTPAGSYPVTVSATGGGVTRTTGFSLTVTASGTTPPPAGADADFQARCAAPGVLKCNGFDNTTSDIVQNVNLWPDGSGVFRAGLDTATKVSGSGALRFTLPPPPTAGANIAGRWSPDTNQMAGALTRTFSQNSTFFVQYRFRLSPDMLSNTWDSSWKVSLFHMNNLTCAGLELTLVNRNMSGVAEMYDQCGAGVVGTAGSGGSTHPPDPPYNIQTNTWPNCAYPNFDAAHCFTYPSNEWITMYYRVDIGTWDQPNSRVQAWVATESSPAYRQWLDTGATYTLTCNSDPCSSNPGLSQGFNNITLTPYMTALSSNAGKAGVTSYMWFDELIVSTQPIAAPGSAQGPPSGSLPAAPTGLVLQ